METADAAAAGLVAADVEPRAKRPCRVRVQDGTKVRLLRGSVRAVKEAGPEGPVGVQHRGDPGRIAPHARELGEPEVRGVVLMEPPQRR